MDLGNASLKSSTNTTPRKTLPPQKGQAYEIVITLHLIADVGIIGMPNAGKSTLLNTLTRSQAKVAHYPFTTLHPNLGMFYGTLLADIPGLIEGSAEGKGLGHSFLRHIESTKYLLHCVSLENEDPLKTYHTTRIELEKYNSALCKKGEVIVLTKTDLVSEKQVEDVLQTFPINTYAVSIYDDASLHQLEKTLSKLFKPLKEEEIDFKETYSRKPV